MVKHLDGRALFDNATFVHDHDLMTDLRGDTLVVRNENHRHVQSPLYFL